jgi:LysM repeat protein
VAFAVALVWVVRASTPEEDRTVPGAENRTAAEQTPTGDDSRGKRTQRVRKTYVVKQGDTASSIAERYDVPLSQIEDLNPELDPQALAPGTRIRLRR